MPEVFSNYFVAHLGEASTEVENRLRQWAAGCVEHSLVRDERSHASLYFARAESRTARQMQSLLRTLSSRWKLPMGKLEAGWLQPLTVDDFRAIVPEAAPTAEAVDAYEERRSAGTVRPCVTPACRVHVTRLSEGFDQRSNALLAATRAQAMRAQIAC